MAPPVGAARVRSDGAGGAASPLDDGGVDGDRGDRRWTQADDAVVGGVGELSLHVVGHPVAADNLAVLPHADVANLPVALVVPGERRSEGGGQADLGVGGGLDQFVRGDVGVVAEDRGRGAAPELAARTRLEVGVDAVIDLASPARVRDRAVVGAEDRAGAPAPLGDHLPVGEEDGVVGVIVARGVVGGRGEGAGRNLGGQLGLNLGVGDRRAVVGRRGGDRHLLREAAPADGLVAVGSGLGVGVVLGEPVDVRAVQHALVERGHARRRGAGDLRDVAPRAPDHLDDLDVRNHAATEVQEVGARRRRQRLDLARVVERLSVLQRKHRARADGGGGVMSPTAPASLGTLQPVVVASVSATTIEHEAKPETKREAKFFTRPPPPSCAQLEPQVLSKRQGQNVWFRKSCRGA